MLVPVPRLEGVDVITVRDLIEMLRHQPPEARVVVEGCDCLGKATTVDFDAEVNCITIRREYGTNGYQPSSEFYDDEEVHGPTRGHEEEP